MVKNSPAMQETWVQSLGLEDPLEKKMATHSSILVQRIPWTEEPGSLKSMGSKMTERLAHSSRRYLSRRRYYRKGPQDLDPSPCHSPLRDSAPLFLRGQKSLPDFLLDRGRRP